MGMIARGPGSGPGRRRDGPKPAWDDRGAAMSLTPGGDGGAWGHARPRGLVRPVWNWAAAPAVRADRGSRGPRFRAGSGGRELDPGQGGRGICRGRQSGPERVERAVGSAARSGWRLWRLMAFGGDFGGRGRHEYIGKDEGVRV